MVEGHGGELALAPLRADGDASVAGHASRAAGPFSSVCSRRSATIEPTAAKRVGLEFVERSRASWDHRKLAGVY